MKQYKSPNDLLEYIISKGVIVFDKEDALDKIKKYSYYSIVNSYKDVFKTTDNNYKKNVSFDEIYALYDFDKNIRSIFLKYILEIETVIKSLLAEIISSKYGIKNYLIIDNFDDTVDKLVIQESIDKIKEEIDKQNGKHEAVTHYISEYGFVPPFVLTKVLTLGELSRLFTMLKQVDRQCFSKEFKVSDKLLKQIMKNMTMVRNICAHNLLEASNNLCYEKKNIMRSWTIKSFFLWNLIVILLLIILFYFYKVFKNSNRLFLSSSEYLFSTFKCLLCSIICFSFTNGLVLA